MKLAGSYGSRSVGVMVWVAACEHYGGACALCIYMIVLVHMVVCRPRDI